MYLRTITYQLGVRLKSLVPCFHKSHLENLVLLVIGIAYSRSVSLPKAASAAPYRGIQVESRVERFERLVQCEKLIPLEALKPVAKKLLKGVSRRGRVEMCAIMDRTMINDTINLLYISVAYGRRALPLADQGRNQDSLPGLLVFGRRSGMQGRNIFLALGQGHN